MKREYFNIIILIIVGFLIWYSFIRVVPTPDPIIDYQYVTDTIIDSIPYAVPEPYPVYTQSKTVIIYEIDTTALDSIKLLLHGKDLIISGLEDSIAINVLYIKQYLTNPKLLAFDLNKDTMMIDLLHISGSIQRNQWPIDLALFNYRWDNISSLTRQATELPPAEEKLFAQYFVGGGVDFLYRSPYISTKIEIDWARIRLYGNIQIGLLKKETSGMQLGIDYKLWQNQ